MSTHVFQMLSYLFVVDNKCSVVKQITLQVRHSRVRQFSFYFIKYSLLLINFRTAKEVGLRNDNAVYVCMS